MVRVRDRDQRGQMQHDVAATHRFTHAATITHIAGKDIEMPPQVRAQGIQPTPGIERVVEHERANIDPSRGKRLHEVRADKTICAGDENTLARKRGRLFVNLVRHLAKVPLKTLSYGAPEKICAVRG